jgi:hypothetical protein
MAAPARVVGVAAEDRARRAAQLGELAVVVNSADACSRSSSPWKETRRSCPLGYQLRARPTVRPSR